MEISRLEYEQLRDRHNQEKLKFHKACEQVTLLNNQLYEMNTRYRRALRDDRHANKLNTSTTMASLQALRNMFHHYAVTKAQECDEIADVMESFDNTYEC